LHGCRFTGSHCYNSPLVLKVYESAGFWPLWAKAQNIPFIDASQTPEQIYQIIVSNKE
jgi:hypothetical protein